MNETRPGMQAVFLADMTPNMTDLVARLDATSQRFDTPCGSGHMVWRRWGSPDAPPLVLLHGGSGSWKHWLHTIPAFADRYDVWAPDLPGLGESAMPPEPLTPASCGAVIADGVRDLLQGRRPHLVCFSFGCHVGAYAARELGPELRSYVLSGSAALGLEHGKRDFAKENVRMSPAERAEVHRSNLHMLMIADAARIDELAVRIQTENIAQARFRSRPFAGTDDIRRLLREIHVPVGAVWGDRDQICSIGGVQARLDAILESQPNLVARLVPDAGHWSMYERPAAFNAALAEVLATLES